MISELHVYANEIKRTFPSNKNTQKRLDHQNWTFQNKTQENERKHVKRTT